MSLFAITSPLFSLFFAITSLGTALSLTTTQSRPGGLLPVILPLTGAKGFTSSRHALHAVSCFWIDSLFMLTPRMLYVLLRFKTLHVFTWLAEPSGCSVSPLSCPGPSYPGPLHSQPDSQSLPQVSPSLRSFCLPFSRKRRTGGEQERTGGKMSGNVREGKKSWENGEKRGKRRSVNNG